jgi:hypothetical protein
MKEKILKVTINIGNPDNGGTITAAMRCAILDKAGTTIRTVDGKAVIAKFHTVAHVNYIPSALRINGTGVGAGDQVSLRLS